VRKLKCFPFIAHLRYDGFAKVTAFGKGLDIKDPEYYFKVRFAMPLARYVLLVRRICMSLTKKQSTVGAHLALPLLLVTLLVCIAFLPTRAFGLYLGLHMDLTYDGYAWRRTAAIDKAVSVNAVVSRNSFLWHLIEPTRGNYDWSRVDAVVQELGNKGIEPLFCIVGSPSWANGVSTSTADYHFYVPTDEAQFQTWVTNYKTFVTNAVTRYKGKVRKWELWNEENEHWFWRPKPNVDQYIRWYREIYGAIKSIDPGAEVALGGMTGLNASGPEDYNGKTFLTLLYQKSLFPDIIAIHPYSDGAPDVHQQWQNNFDDIAMIRQIMVDYGQSNKGIWVTEWGWGTNRVDQATQANWLSKSLQMLKTQYPYVSLATYFVDYDREPTYYFGLFTSSFQEKRAASVFRSYAVANPPLSPWNLRQVNQ
jgi:hypothetical protein